MVTVMFLNVTHGVKHGWRYNSWASCTYNTETLAFKTPTWQGICLCFKQFRDPSDFFMQVSRQNIDYSGQFRPLIVIIVIIKKHGFIWTVRDFQNKMSTFLNDLKIIFTTIILNVTSEQTVSADELIISRFNETLFINYRDPFKLKTTRRNENVSASNGFSAPLTFSCRLNRNKLTVLDIYSYFCNHKETWIYLTRHIFSK